jgi:hypothetical protein
MLPLTPIWWSKLHRQPEMGLMRNWGEIERRRAIRHLFGGAAEVINVESQTEITSVARDLSLYGCFVTSKAPFPKGTGVRLRITNSKANFSAVGHVAFNLPDEGMGIAFAQVEPKDQAVLEEWLAPARGFGEE